MCCLPARGCNYSVTKFQEWARERIPRITHGQEGKTPAAQKLFAVRTLAEKPSLKCRGPRPGVKNLFAVVSSTVYGTRGRGGGGMPLPTDFEYPKLVCQFLPALGSGPNRPNKIPKTFGASSETPRQPSESCIRSNQAQDDTAMPKPSGKEEPRFAIRNLWDRVSKGICFLNLRTPG